MIFVFGLVLVSLVQVSTTIYTNKPCGTSTVQPTLTRPKWPVFLQGGYPVKPHSWPWIVSLQYRDCITGCHWKPACTGTLVSHRKIITHGHCLYGRSGSRLNWLAVLGAHNISTLANPNGLFAIESLENPDDTFTSTLLISLSNDIPESPYINSICLRRERFPVGYSECFIAGWNNQNEGNLTQARVKIVSEEEYNVHTGNYLSTHEVAAVRVEPRIQMLELQSFGEPLMCRNLWNDNIGSWFLEGYLSWTSFGRNGQIYSVFNRYLPIDIVQS